MLTKRTSTFYINFAFAIILLLVLVDYALNYQTDSYRDELALGIAILIVLFIYFYLKKKTIAPLVKIADRLVDTRTNNVLEKIEDIGILEIDEVSTTVNQLRESIQNALGFIKSIEEGDLDQEYDESDQGGYDDVLRDVLVNMRTQMRKISNEDNQRTWTAEGLGKFADLLRVNSNNMNELGDSIISNVVKYVDANQGGLFILNESEEGEGNEDSRYLELIACYAYDRKKYMDRKILVGEGLLGQTFLEKETVYYKEVPTNHIKITSGLGEAPPNSLLIVPLKVNDEVFGVIELASFHEFEPYKIELIEKLGENIAATISSVKINNKTKKLLEESQQQTEELMAQEEEMRQNQEEMQATQEAVERKQVELEASQKKSKAIFENSLDAILVCDDIGVVNSMNKAGRELLQLGEEEFNMNIHHINIQQLIKKFDPSSPASFLNKKRKTKATTLNQEQVNVEIHVTQENLDGVNSYLAYIRDITADVEKEQQIAENLMYMEELKSELKKLKS